jgi:hypothetical protein
MPTAAILLKEFDSSAFPHIRFARRAAWEEFCKANRDVLTGMLDSSESKRGGKRAKQGINVMLGFIEKEDGTTIDGHQVTAVRKRTREVLTAIAEQKGKVPAEFGSLDIVSTTFFREQMIIICPFLRLCKSHWKVDRLGSIVYPAWYSTWIRRQSRTNVKVESDSSASETETPSTSGSLPPPIKSRSKRPAPKRSHIQQGASASKQLKTSS